jgi:hypothetical protein
LWEVSEAGKSEAILFTSSQDSTGRMAQIRLPKQEAGKMRRNRGWALGHAQRDCAHRNDDIDASRETIAELSRLV